MYVYFFFFVMYLVLSYDELGIHVLQFFAPVFNLLFLNILLLTILFYNVTVNCIVLHARFSFRFGALWTYRGRYAIIIFSVFYILENRIRLEPENMT